MAARDTPSRGAFEAVIGLEVHVQLATASKMFCRCPNQFGAEPNTLTCPICLGYPGALPVINRRAVDLAVRLALALGCTVHERSEFARKSYFYPDLPKGYQITQAEHPLAEHGAVPLTPTRRIPIERLHLEEDTGKLLHVADPEDPARGETRIDFNRCGVPLVEIVSAPEITSGEEAAAYLHTLHRLLRYTATSDANLEEGSLRCDVNVSLRPRGATELGPRVEVKNLNSFRHVARAIEAEVARQAQLATSGAVVPRETRAFDAATGATRRLRTKEPAEDYRYFPEPDLWPLGTDTERQRRLAASLPELPWERETRFVRELGLTPAEAAVLTASRDLADYFEACLAARPGSVRPLASWVRGEVLRELAERGLEPAAAAQALPPEHLAELVALVEGERLSHRAAKEVFAAIWGRAETPTTASARLGLGLVQEADQLAAWVADTLAAFPREAANYRAGKSQLLDFLVGQVMVRSAGRADPLRVRALVTATLAGSPA